MKYDHPEMAASRAQFRLDVVQRKIHLGLVLNFDQLWKSNYRYPQRAIGPRTVLADAASSGP